MAIIINLGTGEAIKVQQQPVWINGNWDCGNIRYDDPNQKDFAAGPPSVGPIAFKLLFKINELVSIRELTKTDPVVQEFMDIVNDPRTDIIDMSLDSVHQGIAYVLSKVYPAPEDEAMMHNRLLDILSGSVD